MPSDRGSDFAEWIWIPPGFAHGNYFPEGALIEYFCSGEYSPHCEAAVSPLAPDLDWSLCPPELMREFQQLAHDDPRITDKDRNASSLREWEADARSDNFNYSSDRGIE